MNKPVTSSLARIADAPPHLGFGASGAWALPVCSDKTAQDVINTALENGVRYFDTAGFYQGGQAEVRLGRTLAEARRSGRLLDGELVLSTKIGKTLDGGGDVQRDFSADAIEAALDTACARLFTETLDIVYLHGPDEHELSSCLPHLLLHKERGRVGAIGVCSEGPHLASAAFCDDVDVVMGRYNIFDKSNAETFRSAKQRGKTVVAIAPLAQGLWQRRRWLPKSLPDLWYIARAAARNRDDWKAAQAASWLHTAEGWTPAEIATAFVADCPDIDAILTTTTRPRNLTEVATAVSRELSPELREKAYGWM